MQIWMHRSMDASPYGYITNEWVLHIFAKRLLEVTFDLMGWPKMGPECKLCKEMYYFWTQQWPTKAIFEPKKAQVGQSDLRVSSVFPKQEAIFSWKYVAFRRWERKSVKRWLEVTIDLMGWAKMGPECKLCTEMYYFLNTTVAHKADFGAQ